MCPPLPVPECYRRLGYGTWDALVRYQREMIRAQSTELIHAHDELEAVKHRCRTLERAITRSQETFREVM